MADITDRNVYILGAGFSAAAGAPLIHNFLDVARELFDDPDSGLDPEERALFREVFEFKKRIAQSREKFRIDLDDIEQLFGLVEMSHRLGRTAEDTRNATVYLIAKTLELAIARLARRPQIRFYLDRNYASVASFVSKVGRPESGDLFTCDIYRYFALLLGGEYDDPHKARFRSNAVITFNYDLVLDHALTEAEIRPLYGLREECESPGVTLLKLHGSTNWAICRDCKEVLILDQKVSAAPVEFRNRPCEKCRKTGLHPFLVPPSWDKSEYQDVMRPVWKKAVEVLERATRICVIGYSMPETDAFFKFLLALGLAENGGLYRFVLVDKVDQPTQPPSQEQGIKRETVEQRYRRMLENIFTERRFTFFGSGFTDFLTRGNRDMARAEMINPSGYV